MVNARGLALHALSSLARGRADRLRTALDTGRLEPREMAFAFELAHGVLRRERLLDFVLNGLAHRGLPRDAQLLTALRLGAYQLLFVAGMPAHAAVHETVELVRSNRGFANALLRRLAGAIDLGTADAGDRTELALGDSRVLHLAKPLPDDEAARLAIVHSLPDFLVARWCERLGLDAVRGVAAAASEVPGVFLRAAAGIDPAALAAALREHGVEVEATAAPGLLRWSGGNSPFATAAFTSGQFVVQDPTAMRAALAVPCAAGDTVIDLCAAPGTKTTLLAERVRPGRVFAFDVDGHRRQRIVENVQRLRLGDVVRVVDAAAALPRDAAAVLADVPCSNTGVLGRRVEVRQRLSPSTFAAMAATQRTILTQAIGLVRPGGAVVYSTCSIDHEENDAVVDAVLAAPSTPPCEVVARQLTLPAAGQHDGGFHAVLRRR